MAWPIGSKRNSKRKSDQAQKNNAQGYWFGPGDSSPQRAPDFGNVMRPK